MFVFSGGSTRNTLRSTEPAVEAEAPRTRRATSAANPKPVDKQLCKEDKQASNKKALPKQKATGKSASTQKKAPSKRKATESKPASTKKKSKTAKNDKVDEEEPE